MTIMVPLHLLVSIVKTSLLLQVGLTCIAGWPTDTPNVFGGGAHGNPTGFFSGVTGQIFAYSGLDGPTNSLTNFVALFENQSSYDMRFGAKPASARLLLRPAAPVDEVFVATNDAIYARHKGGAVQMAWSAWNSLVGSVPSDAYIEFQDVKGNASGIFSFTDGGEEALANCTSKSDKSIVMCSAAVDYPYPRLGFAVSFGSGAARAAARNAARAASDGTYMRSLIQERLKWLNRTPKLTKNPQFQMLLNKAVSVMRVNSLAPEGDILEHWSTPDRVPHKFMWLWDSCYHSMARSILNSTIGWEFVKSMLSVQDANGFVPIQRSPSGGEESQLTRSSRDADKQTQPPLLTWAVMENYRLGKQAHVPSADLLARLKYSAPRLEKYLIWDFENRGDPTGTSPLLYWVKGTESGMDNSQRFDNYNVSKPLLAVDFSVFAARESSLLSQMFDILGQSEKSLKWSSIARNISSSVHSYLWDVDRKFYFDRHTERDGRGFSPIAAVSGLLPLWLPDIPADRVTALVATLSNKSMFSTPVSLPSVAANTEEFSTDMWRGPMWINTNYHVSLALIDKGHVNTAKRLMMSTIETVNFWYQKYGVVFEFYDALNKTDPTKLLRKGHTDSGGVRDYHWTAALTLRILLALESL